VGPNVKVLSPRPGLDARFLFHQLPLLLPRSRGYGRHYQYIARSSLTLAPLPEQRRIVAAIEEQFSRIDAGMAALERIQRNVQRIRAASLVNAFKNIEVSKTLSGRELFSFV